MNAAIRTGLDPALGVVAPQAPNRLAWMLGGAAALAVHLAAAAPFLAAPVAPVETASVEEGPPIGVTLAPLVAPPEPPPALEPEPEPVIEESVIQERASDSPPPAPPAKPRPTPKLPDITPRAIPEIWRGAPGSGGGLSYEEFLTLQAWLTASRQAILSALSYPDAARRQALVGFADITVTATRDGRIVDWRFIQTTGHDSLDYEVERAVKRVGRLPRFPSGAAHEQLSFTTRVVFVLVEKDRIVKAPDTTINPSAPGAPGAAATAAASSAVPTGLSVSAIARCARTADELSTRRREIEARRDGIDVLGADYQRQAMRAHRDGREPSLRVRNLLRDYEANVAAFDAAATAFEADTARYVSSCGGGSASWDDFRAACASYAASGNAYCEAFGDHWRRLKVGG